jgi:L-seryl-tRNA(Ser) seleniumtransferase
LADELPTLRWLSRDISELQQLADSLLKSVQDKCNDFQVCIAPTHSQVGSGALPIDILESIALKITMPNRRRPGKALNTLGKAFRDLPVPVIGRITDDAVWFDLRCLEKEEHFIKNLQHLKIK